MTLYGVDITIQWIPGHSHIRLNDKADGLAKQGSHMQQEHVKTLLNKLPNKIQKKFGTIIGWKMKKEGGSIDTYQHQTQKTLSIF